MLRSDLEPAGIDFADESERRVDFHALRHTFATMLKQAGVHPRTAQALARHSTFALTMEAYTHSSQSEEAEAVERLPDLSVPPEREPAAAAVGDGTGSQTVWASCWASEDGQAPTSADDDGRTAERAPERDADASSCEQRTTARTPRARWRRREDSNPRTLAGQRFSKPPQSAALPRLRPGRGV